MTKFILHRLISLMPVLLGITVIGFLLIRLIPGDPAEVMLGERATEAALRELRQSLGLDQPLSLQYVRYLSQLAHGDLGKSIQTGIDIVDELKARLPASLELALVATLIAVAGGILAGTVAAVKHGSLIDTASMVGSLLGVSLPVYVLALTSIWFLAVQLKWLPPGGRLNSITEWTPITGFIVLDSILTRNWPVLLEAVQHLILPAFSLSLATLATVARITRASLLEVLSQDYIRTARSKGLKERQVVVRHALRNSLLPVVTIVGIQFGAILSGAVITETIFSWPGIGRWVYESITRRDYPVVQAMTLFIGLVFVLSSLLVDILYAWLDPRVSYE